MPRRIHMKRTALALALVLVASIAFAGGANENSNGAASNRIVVGATPVPHAEMLNLVVEDMAALGYELEVKEFTDYVTPNTALEDGQLDANFFQHIPYMESFNEERGYHLVNAGGIHIEPIALYSKRYDSLEAIPDGATFAIPNDTTNEGRALLLLQSAGLIEISKDAGISATVLDITGNPHGYKFVEVEAASLPRVIEDVDAAVINGNYAIPAGLSALNDGLVIEGADSPYVNIIAVKAGNEDSPAIKALVQCLQSQRIRDWVQENYPNGEVVLVF